MEERRHDPVIQHTGSFLQAPTIITSRWMCISSGKLPSITLIYISTQQSETLPQITGI